MTDTAVAITASAKEIMDAALYIACHARPYFSRGLHGITLIPMPGLCSGPEATLACDRYWRVYYNPDITRKYRVPMLAGMITHELGHLMFQHADRMDLMGTDTDRLLWNISGDLTINPDLMDTNVEIYTPLPDWAVLPAKFNLPENLATETYYRQLIDNAQPMSGSGIGELHDCGSAAHGTARGYELPPPEGANDQGQTPIEAQILRRQMAMDIHAAAKNAEGRGRVPAGVLRWADSMMQPQVNYRAYVNAALRNSYVTIQRGKSDYTFKIPSRRQHFFGNVIMPSTFTRRIRVGVIIDTSGSVNNKQLSQCVAEVRGFLMQINSQADIYAVSCDAQVSEVRKITHVSQIQLIGGGGTDMPVAFTELDHIRPILDMIVCLTDCLTPWPDQKPRQQVVIINVGNGDAPDWPCKVVTVPVVEEAA